MIVTSIGILTLIIIILLLISKINNKDKYKESNAIILLLLVWIGLPIALATISCGIIIPTNMGEWKVKETIGATLLSSDKKDILGEYTYQYLIPEKGNSKPNIINYTFDSPIEEPPILVRCERKAEPTIWTLGLGSIETKYVFYNSDDTISEIQLK